MRHLVIPIPGGHGQLLLFKVQERASERHRESTEGEERESKRGNTRRNQREKLAREEHRKAAHVCSSPWTGPVCGVIIVWLRIQFPFTFKCPSSGDKLHDPERRPVSQSSFHPVFCLNILPLPSCLVGHHLCSICSEAHTATSPQPVTRPVPGGRWASLYPPPGVLASQ